MKRLLSMVEVVHCVFWAKPLGKTTMHFGHICCETQHCLPVKSMVSGEPEMHQNIINLLNY